MDFHLSKENIQPLRRGRNVTQLGIAIQAQSNAELQRELAQQKEEFENAIRSYEGDDPLELWYHYISWNEQSYPKQGHEGNLVPLLEHCLGKFENDKRYVNDRRFCKLWIKYFDLQNNPFELYQMMYARGLCRECADMYRAWSYYHEVSGDFRNAHNILELGIKNQAQPIDDLELAISTFFNAIGQHELGETQSASSSLQEKRQALTSLQTYRPGRVGSVRTAAGEAGVVPSAARSGRSNKVVPIYEDGGYDFQGAGVAAAAAAPVSLINVAKRQDAPKENTLNPGPWTTVPVKKRHTSSYRGLPFTVHEDTDTIVITGGIRLPPNHPTETLEDYSTWKVPLVIYEPPDERMRPMYPKAKAYPAEDVEFSLEEIRSVRYRRTKGSQPVRTSLQMVKDPNINFSLERQSNCSDRNIDTQQNHIQVSEQSSPYVMYQDPVSHSHQTSMKPGELLISHQQFPGTVSQMHCEQEPFQQSIETNPYLHQQSISNNLASISNIHYQENSVKTFPQMSQDQLSINLSGQQRSSREMQQNSFVNHMNPNQRPVFSDMDHGTQGTVIQQSDSRSGENLGQLYGASSGWPQEQQFHGQPFLPLPISPTEPLTNISRYDIWNSPSQSTSVHLSPRTNKPTFDIYEQSNVGIQEQIQPEGSAMKTPFKVLSAEDMAETGSRGGMEVAAAAQPVGSAVRQLAMQDDSSNSSFCDLQPNMTFNCDTQMFNINLNMMKVSTPQSKTSDQKAAINGSSSKKQLFGDLEESYYDAVRREPLSTILEETKVLSSTASSSSSSSAATKSSVLASHTKNPTMVTISEEHSNYLAQNLKANEELRSSLLGNLMDLDSQPPPPPHQHQPMQSSPVPSLPSSPTRRVPAPTLVTPLKRAPSDPFRANVIKELLERVDFPGVHGQGFVQLPFFSKLRLSKDVVRIGSDAYVIEKQLGKGTYGVVFKAQDLNMGRPVALKYQSPPNKWEFYICRELQARLANHPLVNRFMDVTIGYFCDRASILMSEYMPCGSLLDLVNVVKQKSGKTLKESLCIYFSIEMLKIVEAMHQAKIIHADIKPDNFLISVTADNNAILQLIDFGCSIDMRFFPEGTSFTKKVITEDFVCCEMRDGRPWNYHTDLFCVAASTHVLLFDKYVALQKRDDRWSITHRLARYMKVDLWNMFFSSLLNQQRGPCEIEPLVFLLNEALRKFHHDDFLADMRYIVNILRNR